MRALLVLIFLVVGLLAQAEEPLVREAVVGECFPPPVQVKEYLEKRKTIFGRTHVTYTCLYYCVNSDNSLEEVVGTHLDKFWSDDGKPMICEGFRKYMKWVKTPTSTERWGYWTLGGRGPFSAKKSTAPEVREWYKLRF